MTAVETRTTGSFLANTGWLLADYAIRSCMGLVVGIAIARQFGPALTGTLNYALALVACLTPIFTLGLDAVVVHSLAIDPGNRRTILGTSAALRVVASVAGYACFVVVGFLLSGGDEVTRRLVTIVALQLIFQVGDVADFEFQSRLDGAARVKSRLTAFVLASLARLVLVGLGSLFLLAAMTALEAFLASVLLFAAYQKRYSDMRSWRWNREIARQILSRAWPLGLSAFLLTATANIDRLFLGQLSGAAEVGLYVAAYQLSGPWYALAVIVTASAGPGIAKAYGSSKEQYIAQSMRIQIALTLAALAIGVATTLLSTRLVGILFGSAFAPSAAVLAVHVWTGLLVFHVHFRSWLFVVEGKQKFVAVFAGLGLAANLVLNLLLDTRLGALGAAYASLGSWLTCAVIWPLLFKQTRDSVWLFFGSLNPLSWRHVLG